MFELIQKPRGRSATGIVMGLMRLPVIATVAELDRARHGDHVLLEARISPSNAFTVLETWIREDHKYVVHTGNFAAYWKRRARPVSNGVTDEVQEVQSVPAGLRVQVEQADVAIENDDFIPGFEGGSEGISGGDAPPPVDLVRGFEIGEFVTVQGRLHNNGRRWAIEAERVDEATAAHYVASLKSDASESERLSRAFSGVLIALALVVGVPSVIGGVYCLRRFSMNPPATSLARD